MKFLAIDYGKKRIGIAVSDESGLIAFPKSIIDNNEKTLDKVGEILGKEKISDVVIGESLDLSGVENRVEEDIDIFIEELESRYGVKIYKQPEFLTSVEARKGGKTKIDFHIGGAHSKIKKKKNKKVDDSAAALILQRFLDKYNKNNGNPRRI